jgi:hypothetical protein
MPQIFIRHTRPFLLHLAETPSLLVQPPPSALPYLQRAPGGHCGSMPSPPSLHPRAAHPASFQTPSLPAVAGWGPGSPSPYGLLGTPSRGGGGCGGMLLLSPGAWRISRSGTTPLASPQTGAGTSCRSLLESVRSTQLRMLLSIACAWSRT